MLVFDSARAHLGVAVKNYLHERGILFCVIPGGLTGLLQPADVMWFRPLKIQLSQSIRMWKQEGPFERTRNGSVRPPAAAQIAEWFAAAWSTVDSECIRKSFQVAFLGNIDELLIARNPSFERLFLEHLGQGIMTNDTVSEDSAPDDIEE